MIHKSVSGLKDTEHDYELLPKHLMSVERCSKDHRRARSIKKYSSNIRSSSAYKADRRDMRQIDEFFAPEKRKAGAASPESDTIKKSPNQTVMFSHVRYSLIVTLVMGSLVLESYTFSNYGSRSGGLILMPISIIQLRTMS